MRIFHFRASIVTTRLNTLYPQFIGTFPISTIFTVSAVFSSSPVLTVNTIFSVGTILSVNAILTIGTILTVNAILTIGTIFTVNAIFTICTNTGIFPINIPVPIGTDYYLWRSSIFTYRSLSGIFSIDYPISIFSNCNSSVVPATPSSPLEGFPVSTPSINQLPLSPIVTTGGTASSPFCPSLP